MKKLILAATFLVYIFAFQRVAQAQPLASSIQTPPVGQMVVDSRIVKMPDGYNFESRDVSFCYGFAASNLINQMLFVILGQNYEPISILDLAVYGSGVGAAELMLGEGMKPIPFYDDFGNEYRSLIYAKFVRKVAAESCAPFQRLKILQSSNPNRYEDFKALAPILKPAFDARSAGVVPNYSSIADGVLAWEPNLKSAKNQVVDVLKNNQLASFEDFQKILGGIVIPNACKENAVTLPTFEVSLTKIDASNRGQVADYFISTLNRERPLSWEFCIDDGCKTQHVLVVFGWRKLCTQDMKTCSVQFLLRDSGTQVSGHPGDFWVDQMAIDGKIDLMFKNYEALSKASILPNRIINLEYR